MDGTITPRISRLPSRESIPLCAKAAAPPLRPDRTGSHAWSLSRSWTGTRAAKWTWPSSPATSARPSPHSTSCAFMICGSSNPVPCREPPAAKCAGTLAGRATKRAPSVAGRSDDGRCRGSSGVDCHPCERADGDTAQRSRCRSADRAGRAGLDPDARDDRRPGELAGFPLSRRSARRVPDDRGARALRCGARRRTHERKLSSKKSRQALMVMQRQPFPSRLRAFAVVSAQMALVVLLVWSFEIEEQKHFFPVLCLAAGGFVVHAWLPERFRAGLFALLSLAGIVLVLGGFNGAAVIGLGVGLIAVCHLPLPVRFRAVLLLLAGVALAMFRVDYPA